MTQSKYDIIRKFMMDNSLPDYRYKQLADAIFRSRIGDFLQMQLLPKHIRHLLVQEFGTSILGIKPVATIPSKQSEKVLFELHDRHRIEAVAMRYRAGWESFCISSQSGCGFGCTFCATGAIGLKRNLTADEITDQVLYFYLQGYDIDSISLMGMGEALANPATLDALRLFTDTALFGLSPRRITVSTIGVLPMMERLMDEFPQVNLTFSLHSPFNDQRSELIPLNEKYSLNSVMEFLDTYIQRTHRKVYIAYVLLNGVNDSPEHADGIISLLKGRGSWDYLFHVNLIRYNPAVGTPIAYQRPEEKNVAAFRDRLKSAGLNVTVRQSFGVEIDAACGQLYGRYPVENISS